MKILRVISLAVIFGAALFAGVLLYFMNYWTPTHGRDPVDIPGGKGDSLATVTRKLRDQELVANGFLFSLWARLNGAEKRIHQGLYRVETRVPPRDILDRLVTGRGVFQTVTIPEGLTVQEIAELLEKLGIANKDKFIAEARNENLLVILGLNEKGLEGYLFPSTYHFTPATPEKEIIATMAEQFRKVSLPVLNQRDGPTSLTSHEILTLASIIEKETGIESERSLISAVFHNRLQRQMPLQSDPTVIYGLRGFNGNLTRKNLQEPTPYNTYRIAGLPPGPICNPGLSSIRAALQPARVSYLYFVSKNDGTHLFSETIEAHNQAVKNYQPVREPPPNRSKSAMRR